MKKLSKNQWLIVLSCGFLLLVLMVLVLLYDKNHTSPKEVDNDLKQYAQKNHIPSQGNTKAKHHMYVFTDFECSHCYNYHQTNYQKEVKPMIERGDVEYTEIQLPVIDDTSHQYAQMMRAISKTKNNEIYYQYSDLAYQYQRVDKDPVTVLKRLHLDKKDEYAIIQAYEKHKDDKIDKDEIKKRFNADSTPTVFIDGKPITNNKDIKPTLEK